MKAVKRLRALRVDVGEVMMGVKNCGRKRKCGGEIFFAGRCIEFCTREPRSQGPKFWRKVFGLSKRFWKTVHDNNIQAYFCIEKHIK